VASLPEQAIDAIHTVSGSHPGYRAVHAKGILCKGSFTATPQAAELTSAAHMRGEPVPVTVRFSNGTGNPKHPDYRQDGRGMATKFYLPDGSRTDIVALNLPRFFVRTPEDFIKFTRAGKRLIGNLPSPWLALYLATHREAIPAVRAFLALKPPASYTTCRYNGIHSFKWVDADGGERWVRYSWLPEAGEATIEGEEAKRRGRDYLQEEIAERLGAEPARFTLQLQLADESDPIDDPTAVWPKERETVEVGTLELTGLEEGREQGDDILVFDPIRVTDGIELSSDPILHFRSRAYSVSIELRSGVSRPPALDS
jgi:catalase